MSQRGDHSVDLQHVNNFCYNIFTVLLQLQNMFATGFLARSSVSSPASSILMFPSYPFLLQ
jgi:hypothetical protein